MPKAYGLHLLQLNLNFAAGGFDGVKRGFLV